MKSAVIMLCHEEQIFNSVIISDMVDMMYYLIFGKVPSDMSFHHKDVLHNISVSCRIGMIRHINFDVAIASFLLMPSKLIVSKAFA